MDFSNREDLGVQAVVEGHAVVVGRPSLLADWAQHLPPALTDAVERAQAAGRTAVAVGWDGRARGVVVVGDTVKPTSAEAIARLRDLGLTPVLGHLGTNWSSIGQDLDQRAWASHLDTAARGHGSGP